MKTSTALFLCLLIVVVLSKKDKGKLQQKSSKQTTISFIVPQQSKKKHEVIKFSLKVSEEDPSMVEAIQKAQQLESRLRNLYIQFCYTYSNQKVHKFCEQYVQCGDYEIKAEYYHLRGKETFKAFIVNFEMQFITTSVENIGLLIDQLSGQMDDEKMVLGKIVWDDLSQDTNVEELMDEGMARAKKACQKIGMKLYRIKSVESYTGNNGDDQKKEPKPKKKEQGDGQEEQEQEQEQKPQQQDDQQQQQAERYKIVVVCKVPKHKMKKSTAKKLINIAKKTGGEKVSRAGKLLLE